VVNRSADEDEVRRLAREAIDDYRPLLDRLRDDNGNRSERLDAVLDAELPRYRDALRRLGE
jgi:hypothetical protein